MPTARRRSLLSQRSLISNVLMSRLVRLTSRCVAKLRVDATVEHDAVELSARCEANRQMVADLHAIDVRLLEIRANPQIIGIDQRDDRLSGIHDFAFARRAH